MLATGPFDRLRRRPEFTEGAVSVPVATLPTSGMAKPGAAEVGRAKNSLKPAAAVDILLDTEKPINEGDQSNDSRLQTVQRNNVGLVAVHWRPSSLRNDIGLHY